MTAPILRRYMDPTIGDPDYPKKGLTRVSMHMALPTTRKKRFAIPTLRIDVPNGVVREHTPHLLYDGTTVNYWLHMRRAYATSYLTLTPAEVKLLLTAEEQRRIAQADRALTQALILAAKVTATLPSPDRPAIPVEVKRYVWQRDGGRCVECGSVSDLQFGHVIPFSWGGSSTAENLQLECATCNLTKGAAL